MKEMTTDNSMYELVGFVKSSDIIPSLVYLVFKKENAYYFQNTDENIEMKDMLITGFEPVSELFEIKLFKNKNVSISDKEFKNKKISIGSKPIYALQTSENYIQIGEYDRFLEFLKNCKTDNKKAKFYIDFYIDCFLYK